MWLIHIFAGFAFISVAGATEVAVVDLTVKPPKEIRLSGETADAILTAFNQLPFDGTKGARCHFPAYRIISPFSKSPSLDATICFQCWNVSFVIPKKEMQGFTQNVPEVLTLQNLLKQQTEQDAAANP